MELTSFNFSCQGAKQGYAPSQVHLTQPPLVMGGQSKRDSSGNDNVP